MQFLLVDTMAQAELDIEGEIGIVSIPEIYLAKSYNCNKKIVRVGYLVQDYSLVLQLRDERNNSINLSLRDWFVFFNSKNEIWKYIQHSRRREEDKKIFKVQGDTLKIQVAKKRGKIFVTFESMLQRKKIKFSFVDFVAFIQLRPIIESVINDYSSKIDLVPNFIRLYKKMSLESGLIEIPYTRLEFFAAANLYSHFNFETLRQEIILFSSLRAA